MEHDALAAGNVAVVTGAASGIGFAAAVRFAEMGMRVCLADLPGERLEKAGTRLAQMAPGGEDSILAVPTDVGDLARVRALEVVVRERFGQVDVLMNNAGVQVGSSVFGPSEQWREIMRVNMWGVIYGSQAFGPGMIAQGTPGLIINTGSKQGITTPPGDPAYNVSKAGVKTFTEAMQHELRNTVGCKVEARLLIPGFVYTPLTAKGRKTKPEGAWTPEETIEFMIQRLRGQDFYILCPDNEVTREMDEKRIAWAAGDIVHNRPPLSRWHPDYIDAFNAEIDTKL